jgi:regulator of replication initiation timing
MNDVAGIEARLSAALDRIAGGVERIVPPDAAALEASEAKLAEVTAALEAEKSAHGMLAERVKAIRIKQEQTVTSLEAKVLQLQEQVSAIANELGGVKRVNRSLRESARNIRQSLAAGVLEQATIDQAMAAELEATRAAQIADRNELDAILAELTPLIEEKADV